MGVDLRQVVAGILTITMFVMLGNMIKRDHFDSVEVSYFFNHHSFLFHSQTHTVSFVDSFSFCVCESCLNNPYCVFFFFFIKCFQFIWICFSLHFKVCYFIYLFIFYGICLQLRLRSRQKCKSNKTHFLSCCFLWNQFIFYVEIDRVICLTSVCLMRK